MAGFGEYVRTYVCTCMYVVTIIRCMFAVQGGCVPVYVSER